MTFGASLERYQSENVFFPGSQSVYVYNSLQDFLTDASGYVANPSRTTSPVSLARFQVRYMNIPGAEKPIQPLEVLYGGAYAQDEWRPASNVTVTAGIRMDIPFFEDTGFANAEADARTFRDENGQPVQYESGELPDASILWSPRVGINWDVNGNARTQVRGGTGVFTGRPAYVWISNQIGNTGVLTGFEELNNTTARPFNPDPNRYKPTTPPTGAPAAHLRAGADQSDFRVPADLALEHRGRSPPAGPLHAHWRVPLQQGRQRRLLHQRQPAGGADRRSSVRTVGRDGRTIASTPTSRTQWC